MVGRAASQLGAPAPDSRGLIKRFATDAGFVVCDDAVQIHGGDRYLGEYRRVSDHAFIAQQPRTSHPERYQRGDAF